MVSALKIAGAPQIYLQFVWALRVWVIKITNSSTFQHSIMHWDFFYWPNFIATFAFEITENANTAFSLANRVMDAPHPLVEGALI